MRHLLKLPDVQSRTGLLRAAILDGVRNNTFPQPKRRGVRILGWTPASIESYLGVRDMFCAAGNVVAKGKQ